MFNSKESVKSWNEKCNLHPKEIGTEEYWQSLSNQAERLQEELNEFILSIKQRDKTENIDALADMQYVLDGLAFLTQANLEGAMKAVCSNNDLKYFDNQISVQKAAREIADKVDPEINIQQSVVGGKTYYSIHRNSDNKVMKPVGHPKVDLRPFIANHPESELMVVLAPNCPLCNTLTHILEGDLNISNYTKLDPFYSPADYEFCLDNSLTRGDIVFYNGSTIEKTSIIKLGEDPSRVLNWLKSVGAS